MNLKSKHKKNISLEDFNIKELIGKGSFGEVFLVEHKSTGDLFAMKMLNKSLTRSIFYLKLIINFILYFFFLLNKKN